MLLRLSSCTNVIGTTSSALFAFWSFELVGRTLPVALPNGRFCCCITGQIDLLASDIRPARGEFVGPLASVYGKDEGGADTAV